MVVGGKYIKRIFLVDDDPEYREYFQQALESIELSTILYTFKNGQDFLDHLTKDNSVKPDIIFLDLNMPKLEGFKSLEHIRSDCRFKDIPFIAIYSTSKRIEYQNISFKLGADAFISKPDTFNGLVNAISEILYENWPKDRSSRTSFPIV